MLNMKQQCNGAKDHHFPWLSVTVSKTVMNSIEVSNISGQKRERDTSTWAFCACRKPAMLRNADAKSPKRPFHCGAARTPPPPPAVLTKGKQFVAAEHCNEWN